jgi:cob(I)alamin adenosyltransferase
MVQLTRIYTKSGDKGKTALGNGTRVPKNSVRVEAYGTVDETNSVIGVARLHADGEIDAMLARIQNDLFDLGGELAVADPGYTVIDTEVITQMEQQIDALNSQLPPLKEFILPGGNRAAALCHQARSVCRRAERRMVELADQEMVNPLSATYLNRFSDLLFVVARVLARQNGGEEVLWQPRKPAHKPEQQGG